MHFLVKVSKRKWIWDVTLSFYSVTSIMSITKRVEVGRLGGLFHSRGSKPFFLFEKTTMWTPKCVIVVQTC